MDTWLISGRQTGLYVGGRRQLNRMAPKKGGVHGTGLPFWTLRLVWASRNRAAAGSAAQLVMGAKPRIRWSFIGGDIPGKAKRGQQALAALVKSEIARWTPIIKAANFKGD
jgi:hypothetical protein